MSFFIKDKDFNATYLQYGVNWSIIPKSFDNPFVTFRLNPWFNDALSFQWGDNFYYLNDYMQGHNPLDQRYIVDVTLQEYINGRNSRQNQNINANKSQSNNRTTNIRSELSKQENLDLTLSISLIFFKVLIIAGILLSVIQLGRMIYSAFQRVKESKNGQVHAYIPLQNETKKKPEEKKKKEKQPFYEKLALTENIYQFMVGERKSGQFFDVYDGIKLLSALFCMISFEIENRGGFQSVQQSSPLHLFYYGMLHFRDLAFFATGAVNTLQFYEIYKKDKNYGSILYFLIKRILRLLPMYVLIVLFTVKMQPYFSYEGINYPNGNNVDTNLQTSCLEALYLMNENCVPQATWFIKIDLAFQTVLAIILFISFSNKIAQPILFGLITYYLLYIQKQIISQNNYQVVQMYLIFSINSFQFPTYQWDMAKSYTLKQYRVLQETEFDDAVIKRSLQYQYSKPRNDFFEPAPESVPSLETSPSTQQTSQKEQSATPQSAPTTNSQEPNQQPTVPPNSDTQKNNQEFDPFKDMSHSNPDFFDADYDKFFKDAENQAMGNFNFDQPDVNQDVDWQFDQFQKNQPAPPKQEQPPTNPQSTQTPTNAVSNAQIKQENIGGLKPNSKVYKNLEKLYFNNHQNFNKTSEYIQKISYVNLNRFEWQFLALPFIMGANIGFSSVVYQENFFPIFKPLLKDGITVPITLGCYYAAWFFNQRLVDQYQQFFNASVPHSDQDNHEFITYWKFQVLTQLSILLIPNVIGLYDLIGGMFRFSLARQISRLLYICFMIYEVVMRHTYINHEVPIYANFTENQKPKMGTFVQTFWFAIYDSLLVLKWAFALYLIYEIPLRRIFKKILSYYRRLKQ